MTESDLRSQLAALKTSVDHLSAQIGAIAEDTKMDRKAANAARTEMIERVARLEVRMDHGVTDFTRVERIADDNKSKTTTITSGAAMQREDRKAAMQMWALVTGVASFVASVVFALATYIV